MTVFGIAAALLAAGALFFLLPPLLGRGRSIDSSRADATNVAVYRDELAELDTDLAAGTLNPDEYGEARREIERRLIDDVRAPKTSACVSKSGRSAALVLGIAVPLFGAMVYLAVGNPRALTLESAGTEAPALTPQAIEAMVAKLAARLQSSPEDATGWRMLGRSYAVLGRFSESAAAYAKAVERLPRDAQLLADYAEAVAMAQGQRLDGEPERILALALKYDPNNLKALAMAGSAAFERHDFKTAVAHWQKILAAAPPDSDLASSVRQSIAEAQKRDARMPFPKRQ